MAKGPSGVAVDKGLHSRVKSAAAERGTNLEGAYDAALKVWLGESGIAPPTKWHGILDELLACKFGDIATATKTAMESFVSVARAVARKSAK